MVVVGNDEHGCPKFVQVKELLVRENKVLLGVGILKNIEYYDHHYHSWVVECTTKMSFFPVGDLASRQVLTPRTILNSHSSHLFVTLKFVFVINFCKLSYCTLFILITSWSLFIHFSN